MHNGVVKGPVYAYVSVWLTVGEIDTIGLRYDTTGLKEVWDLFNIYYKIVHEVRQTDVE